MKQKEKNVKQFETIYKTINGDSLFVSGISG
jgi:hypothetical protein